MAVRTDVLIDFDESPRLIRIAAPSVEISIQDLYDSVRVLEDDIPNMNRDRVIDAAGKEDLGGGVEVGITAELQNARVQFAARVTSVSTGTVTTGDALGVTLTDISATFEDDLVVAGAWVANFADQSIATVLEVVSQTVLRCEPLADGTDDQWDIGDAYKVWNVIQCEVNGGNLVAIDAVGADLDSIFNSAGTQVVRTASSSATSQNIGAIEFSSFAGKVTIDVANGSAGAKYPQGTDQFPINNLTDALTVAVSRGITELEIRGTAVIGASDVIDGYTLKGNNELTSVVVLTAGCSTIGTRFVSMIMTGTADGGIYCNKVGLSSVVGLGSDANPSLFLECILLEGTVALKSGLSTPQNMQFVDCVSGVSTGTGTTFDFNGGASRVSFRKYGGVITLANCTAAAQTAEVEMDQGEVTIAASCTAGSIAVRGIAKLNDSSAGTTVSSAGLAQFLTWEEAVAAHTTTGSAGDILDTVEAKVLVIPGLV